MTNPVTVHAIWYDEAKVWVATSDDVPGLATEADSFESLVSKLKTIIPELLDRNGPSDGKDIRFKVLSECTAIAHRRRAVA